MKYHSLSPWATEVSAEEVFWNIKSVQDLKIIDLLDHIQS